MENFVVYHNPDVMGYDAIDVDRLAIYTNKEPENTVGGRVWLITGEGKPRRFLLRAAFLVAEAGPSDRAEFKTLISGKAGHFLHPMPELNSEPWFAKFKKTQGNFAFGFQPIRNNDVVAGLMGLLKASSV